MKDLKELALGGRALGAGTGGGDWGRGLGAGGGGGGLGVFRKWVRRPPKTVGILVALLQASTEAGFTIGATLGFCKVDCSQATGPP